MRLSSTLTRRRSPRSVERSNKSEPSAAELVPSWFSQRGAVLDSADRRHVREFPTRIAPTLAMLLADALVRVLFTTRDQGAGVIVQMFSL